MAPASNPNTNPDPFHIAVFARAPLPGRAKTRLIPLARRRRRRRLAAANDAAYAGARLPRGAGAGVAVGGGCAG